MTFLDKNRRVVEILKKNIERGAFTERCRPIAANIFSVGAAPNVGSGFYDLVFVDPPYIMSNNSTHGSKVALLMELLSTQVKKEALVLLRTHANALTCRTYGSLTLIDTRRWGSMALLFYQNTLTD